MKTPVKYSYRIQNEDGIVRHVEKFVESTDQPPICFYTDAQPLVSILWLQKEALIARIIELENSNS
jgi:hypothetical protein